MKKEFNEERNNHSKKGKGLGKKFLLVLVMVGLIGAMAWQHFCNDATAQRIQAETGRGVSEVENYELPPEALEVLEKHCSDFQKYGG